MANRLRALDWETKTALLEAMAKVGEQLGGLVRGAAQTGEIDKEAATSWRADIQALLARIDEAGLTTAEVRDFVLTAPAGSLEEALLSGAPSTAAKRDAAGAVAEAITRFIRQGQLAGQAAAERLAVAAQIQEAIA